MSARLGSMKKLDLNNVGSWPRNMQIVFAAIVAVVILLLSWLLLLSGKKDELTALEAQETTLRKTFEEKQAQAANLEPLRQQLAQMEQELRQMLRQLPSRTEMADLITDISQTALASGLRNELFRPQPETTQAFYAEKPIQLRLVGNYHQFGAFMSGVASLPRVVIMTMHDISLTPQGKDNALVMAGTVKTYRYLDESEVAAQSGEADDKGAKK